MMDAIQFEINHDNMDADVVLEALTDILKASEEDFQSLKEKTWYKRIWGMLTFSKDNEKRIASGVATLAKLQDVIIKLVLQLSKENAQISECARKNQAQIHQLAGCVLANDQNIYEIRQTLDLLTPTKYRRLEFLSIPSEHQYIMVSVLRKLIFYTEVNDYTQAYIDYIHEHISRFDYAGGKYEYRNIEYLSIDEQVLLYHMVREVAVLMDLEHDNETVLEIIGFITISSNKCKLIDSIVEEAVSVDGLSYLTKPLMQHKNIEITVEDLVFDDEPQTSDLDECSTLDGGTTELVCDESESYENTASQEPLYEADEDIPLPISPYAECRDYILASVKAAFPSYDENSDKVVKQMADFLSKYLPDVIPKTAICLAKGYTTRCLFTTSGIYLVDLLSKSPTYFKYTDLDFNKVAYVHGKKSGKIEKLTLQSKSGASYTVANEPGIYYRKFVQLLSAISAFDTAKSDKAQPIYEMPDHVKQAFGEILLSFAKNCKLSPADGIRRIKDTNISLDLFKELIVWDGADNRKDLNTAQQILQYDVPYPSEESIRYCIFENIVSMLQFSTGETREISAVQMDVVVEMASFLEIDDSLVGALIASAQIPYRILKNDITQKEVDEIAQALFTVAAGAGLPIITVVGSSFLFWNTLWFWFIPGIGTVLGAAALGVAATTAITGVLNHNKSKTAYDELFKLLVSSYQQLGHATYPGYAVTAAKIADETLSKHLETITFAPK